MASADLLLHPVRMRILQTLFDADPMTTTQLRDRIPDVAPATMYRQIAVLARAARYRDHRFIQLPLAGVRR